MSRRCLDKEGKQANSDDGSAVGKGPEVFMWGSICRRRRGWRIRSPGSRRTRCGARRGRARPGAHLGLVRVQGAAPALNRRLAVVLASRVAHIPVDAVIEGLEADELERGNHPM